MRKDRAFFCFALIACTPLLITGCSGDKVTTTKTIAVAEQTNEYSYRTSAADIGDVVEGKRIYFTNRVQKENQIKSEVSGIIKEFYVKKGDRVAKGDLLAEFDEASVLQKKADLESEKESLTQSLQYILEQKDLKVKLLGDKRRDGVISSSEYSDQLSSVDKEFAADILKLENNIKQMETSITLYEDYSKACKVYATVDGIITNVTEYNNINKGNIIFTMSDATSATFTTPDVDYQGYFNTEDVYELETSTGIKYPTKYIGRNEEQNSLVFGYIGEEELLASITVTYELVFAAKEHVLRINNTYLHDVEEQPFVYVLDENGLKDMRFLTLGIKGNSYTEIINGLEEGEVIAR